MILLFVKDWLPEGIERFMLVTYEFKKKHSEASLSIKVAPVGKLSDIESLFQFKKHYIFACWSRIE